MRAETTRSYLSFLWWFVEPLLYMSAFYVVFGLLFQRGGPDFVPFLLCGLIAWKWFASTLRQGANTILGNTNLIRQVKLPKLVLPGTVILINTIKFSFVFILLLMFLQVYGLRPNTAWWALPAILVTQFLFNAACATLASAMVPFLPDIMLLIENGMLLLFFVSGVFFNVGNIPEKMRSYFMLNPVAFILESYRGILLQGRWPGWVALILIALLSLAGILLAQLLMSRYDRLYPKVLMS
jgi:lipopolysaccharide transport system permease protein